MNKKQLYNVIMKLISLSVKRAINESYDKLNEDIVISTEMREKHPRLDHKLVIELNDRLKNGVVKFSFRKKSNNALRRARGTVNIDVIRKEIPDFDWDNDYTPKIYSNPKLVKFFDLDKKRWRACCVDNLLIIIE